MWQMTCPRRHPGLRLLTGKDDDVMFVCVLNNLLFDNMNMLIDFLLTGLQSHPPSYARLQKLFLWRRGRSLKFLDTFMFASILKI